MKWEYIAVLLFLAVTISFVCIQQENIYLTVHDNLDASIPCLKVLSDCDLFFTDGEVPVLGGISRNLLGSELKVYNLLYFFFPAFTAFAIGWFIKILMAIVGFLALGKCLYIDYKTKRSVILFCGFLYGILPVYPISAFSFASLPLLLWLMIKIYKEKKKRYLLGVLFYPLLSEATFFGIFACGYIFVTFVIDWLVSKKPAWRLLSAAFILGIGYIITEYRLFDATLFSDVTSIRATFLSDYVSTREMFDNIYLAFLNGHYHADALHTVIVLPVCIIYFFYLNFRYIWAKKFKCILLDKFNWLAIWIGFNCVMFGVDESAWFKTFVTTLLPPLAGLSFARTLWFNPFLWYFAFMIILLRVNKTALTNSLLVLAFLVICFNSSTYNFLNLNLKAAINNIRPDSSYSELTFREFYAEELFSKIKKDIAYDGEWSVAFGMHPGILQYNTISTLDGYHSAYPVEYKMKFRELMEPEFTQNQNHADYFDSWGGRAYVFSENATYEPVYNMEQEKADLLIDPDVFREMGGKYVFSRVSIKNAEELGFEKVGMYTDDNSPYTIYVYRLT